MRNLIRCESCPLHRFDVFSPFTAADTTATQRFKSGELEVESGTTLLAEGSNAAQLYTALEGMGVRYKTTVEGRRQVINFVFPGDFIGLQAGVMGEMQHSVEATTDMRLCVFDRGDLWPFMHTNPERAFDLTWLSSVEEHMVAEALATVGQQPAEARIAWAVLRLFRRGTAVGLGIDGDSIPFPFRQQDLADAMGLSLVHTNRTLRVLREARCVDWRGDVLQILDLPGLVERAGLSRDTEPFARERPLV